MIVIVRITCFETRLFSLILRSRKAISAVQCCLLRPAWPTIVVIAVLAMLVATRTALAGDFPSGHFGDIFSLFFLGRKSFFFVEFFVGPD